MYAVVEIAGQQYKVTKADTIHVPKLESEVGQKVTFDKVLLVGDDKQTKIGAPYIAGTLVEATVVKHLKDDKVVVFKKNRRKGYKVRRGHRQQYTTLEITKVA
ncbi:MAG: 50S ribosomal protein L21 [Bacteroidota bacterium]